MIGQGELRTPHASRRALTRTKTICPPFGGHNYYSYRLAGGEGGGGACMVIVHMDLLGGGGGGCIFVIS